MPTRCLIREEAKSKPQMYLGSPWPEWPLPLSYIKVRYLLKPSKGVWCVALPTEEDANLKSHWRVPCRNDTVSMTNTQNGDVCGEVLQMYIVTDLTALKCRIVRSHGNANISCPPRKLQKVHPAKEGHTDTFSTSTPCNSTPP